jgi:galacturan 1,4-alpha-galacturonidase
MTNASDGARIEVWPGAVPSANVMNAGGGTGYIRNVTYNGMHDVYDDCETKRVF